MSPILHPLHTVADRLGDSGSMAFFEFWEAICAFAAYTYYFPALCCSCVLASAGVGLLAKLTEISIRSCWKIRCAFASQPAWSTQPVICDAALSLCRFCDPYLPMDAKLGLLMARHITPCAKKLNLK